MKKKIKWKIFIHDGVILQSPYEQHFTPIKYNNKYIVLSPQAEEMATHYAKYLHTEYINNKTFNTNFWNSWKKTLIDSEIKSLAFCDFSKIYEYLIELKQNIHDVAKKNDVKIRKALDKFKLAIVDGREEEICNYIVEPAGIFIGRGNHPKLGTFKRRINASDITLNLSKDAPIPDVHYLTKDGKLCIDNKKKWGRIIHDNTVEWIASWDDKITDKKKYVWLSDSSSFKSKNDKIKFELARKLKKKIHSIRTDNSVLLKSKTKKDYQLGTAIYLIDNLALRIGNEKGEDESDTVGITSLRLEHIALSSDNIITLDFYGKDTIRYHNSFTIDDQVYNNLLKMIKNKKNTDQLFDAINSNDINNHLHDYMSNLTAKVFRTYNASNLFQKELRKISTDITDTKILLDLYNKANMKVAVLCNHRKKIPASVTKSIDSMKDKIDDLVKMKHRIQRSKRVDERTSRDNKKIDSINEKIKHINNKIKEKAQLQDISLQTSKVNYIDPRITIGFFKRFNIPLEKVYSKKLLDKFKWALDVDQYFVF